jgi:hypothetical protein
METTENGPTTLTRAQLYDLVWTTPISRLAARYGLSGVGLAKICARHKVPRPSRGYWAKLAHGKTPRKVLLPLVTSEGVITFGPPRPALNRVDAVVATPARFTVTVQDVLTSPHELVKLTLRALSKEKPEWNGLARGFGEGVLDVTCSPAQTDRALRIADALIKAVETAGGRIGFTTDWRKQSVTTAELEGDPVPISIVEMLSRAEYVPDPKAKRTNELYSWHKDPKYTYSPSGRLSLVMDVPTASNERRRWSDAGKNSLESRLPAVMEALTQFSAYIKSKRLEREERDRQRAEKERIRAERERCEREQEEELTVLLKQVDAWHRSRQIRAYVRAVTRVVVAKRGPIEAGSHNERWIEWALRHADRIDPLMPRPMSAALTPSADR